MEISDKIRTIMKQLYLIILAMFLVAGCATIPRASVDISIQLEQQLYALKQANESMINSVFDAKEQNLINYIDSKLFPEYLDRLFENPSIQKIWDEMVASKNYEKRSKVIIQFNKKIQKQYKEIQDSLLVPIREEKKRVIKSFNDEFNIAIQMNSTIMRNIASANTIKESYQNLTSKLINVNRLDSMIINSLQVLDNKLNSVQEGMDVYKKNEDKINNFLKK